jgi:hypothetical protein
MQMMNEITKHVRVFLEPPSYLPKPPRLLQAMEFRTTADGQGLIGGRAEASHVVW